MRQAADPNPAPSGELVAIALAGEAALALCTLYQDTAELAVIDRLPLPGAEGHCRGVPIAASADGTRVYCAWRGDAFRLFSFALDRDARRLTCIGSASLPASMCYLSLSSCGQYVLTSSNTGSVIAISPVDEDGCASEPQLVRDAYKAHCVVEAPNGLIYATSLRGDFVQSYAFDAIAGALTPRCRADLAAGSGPRHIIFTSEGTRAYALSEFAGKLTSFEVDAECGALSPTKTADLLPDADKAWAAELRLTPEQDVLYASERSTSQIFAYRLLAKGGMDLIGAYPAPDRPTAFCLSKAADHLIALGESSGEAWVYRRSRDGSLSLASRNHVGAVPSWSLAL
jgi:6-phosphogluconolactonase